MGFWLRNRNKALELLGRNTCLNLRRRALETPIKLHCFSWGSFAATSETPTPTIWILRRASWRISKAARLFLAIQPEFINRTVKLVVSRNAHRPFLRKGPIATCQQQRQAQCHAAEFPSASMKAPWFHLPNLCNKAACIHSLAQSAKASNKACWSWAWRSNRAGRSACHCVSG